MSVSVSSKVSFFQFCSLLEKISKLAGDDKKKKLLTEFIEEWRKFTTELKAKNVDVLNDDSFFDAMRLLLPHLDRDREAYGIKEHKLAQLFIDIFALNKNSTAGQNLINFKTTKSNKDMAIGDFASIAQLVLKDRCPEKGTLTILQVNDQLDSIARGHVTKDKKEVQKSLLHLMKNVSSCELKWLVRMILKDMKLGMGQKSIFNCFHGDAEELYNVKMSLEKVCKILHDRNVRLHEIEVSLFNAFKPMLATKEEPFNIEKLMHGRSFLIETKYDGERMQLHMLNKTTFKYFSRGGNEYSHVYGEDGNHGNLTQFICNQFNGSVRSCILDGEMMGYDPVNNLIGTKGENIDIKSTQLTTYQPMYVVFDVLFLNDRVLTNQSLRSRRDVLNDLINPLPGRIILSKAVEKSTNGDCIDSLNEAIENGEEGIMIKDIESIYKPNCRQKGGWFKIKPDYIDGLMNDLDLVIIGGYFGIRSELLTHFLLGCISCHGNGDQYEIHTFCKVGTGFTNKELVELNKKLSQEWMTYNKQNTPFWLKLPSTFKQKPDVVIKDPKKSVVLQVKATEIMKSDQYQTKYTLRFPRVEKIRYDKHCLQCLTIDQLNELLKKSKSTLVSGLVSNSNHSDSHGGDGMGMMDKKKNKRRKKDDKDEEMVAAAVVRKKPSLHQNYKAVNTFNIIKGSSSSLLRDKEICVMVRDANDSNNKDDNEEMSKPQLERLIIEHDGEVVQNPDKHSTNFIIAKQMTSLKLRNVVKLGHMDVVKVDWLLRSISQLQLLPWKPCDFIHCSMKTKKMFEDDYDLYGDGYHDYTSPEQLKNLFIDIQLKEEEMLSREGVAELGFKYPSIDDCLFRLFKAAYYNFASKSFSSSLSLESILFRYHGGAFVDNLTDDVTHVFISNKDLKIRDRSALDHLHKLNNIRNIDNDKNEDNDNGCDAVNKRFHIVQDDWVLKCLEMGKVIDERFYAPSCF